jgi:hypothetical protein
MSWMPFSPKRSAEETDDGPRLSPIADISKAMFLFSLARFPSRASV